MSSSNTYCPQDPSDRRIWLNENHQSCQSVRLIYYKSSSDRYNLSWSEAVDDALCFGWIDSQKNAIDGERYMQLFSKRKAKSPSSKINKEKVDRLIQENRMMKAGYAVIQIAKQNGYWNMFDHVEQLIIPKDLETALATGSNAKALSPSSKKSILGWIHLAKKPETRKRRILEVTQLAEKMLKPKQF